MCGKALLVGTDWESFSVEKIRHFSTISTGFSTRFAEKEKKKREKVLFCRKTVWKTRVKLWNTHFFAEKPVENHPFFIRCTAK